MSERKLSDEARAAAFRWIGGAGPNGAQLSIWADRIGEMEGEIERLRLTKAAADQRERCYVDDLAERDVEIERLRGALEWCARHVWDECSIDGVDFQDEMLRRGLLIEVPADAAFRMEHDGDTMLTLVWMPAAVEGESDESR